MKTKIINPKLMVMKGFDGLRYVRHETDSLTMKARLAVNMVEKWGMVAGIEDGEDGSNRAKFRLATPDELVERAISVTEKLFDKLNENKWIEQIPDFVELQAALNSEDEK
jgi:hypothetical protein